MKNLDIIAKEVLARDPAFKKDLTVENMVREYHKVMSRGNGAEGRVSSTFMTMTSMGFISHEMYEEFWSTVSGWEYKGGKVLDDNGNTVDM